MFVGEISRGVITSTPDIGPWSEKKKAERKEERRVAEFFRDKIQFLVVKNLRSISPSGKEVKLKQLQLVNKKAAQTCKQLTQVILRKSSVLAGVSDTIKNRSLIAEKESLTSKKTNSKKKYKNLEMAKMAKEVQFRRKFLTMDSKV